ncbi:MAG: structural protein P5 [Tannerella sp.]|nr:structural protein P5 [Tannerella sp.]
MARGLNNNNPLNIRHNGDVFQGEIKPGTDRAFKQFCDSAHGYRAAFVTLGTYLGRGWNTVDRIISRWAPPSENDTGGYISAVEKWSGVKRDEVLTARSGKKYVKIVAAMARVENGRPAVMADVEAGFALQSKITKTGDD